MVSVFQRRQYVGITKWCHEISKIPDSRKVKHLDFRPFGSVHFVGTTCRCRLALGPSKSECETGRRSGWSLSTPIRVISPASSRPTSIPNRLRPIWRPGGWKGDGTFYSLTQVPNQKAFPKISPTFPADFYFFHRAETQPSSFWFPGLEAGSESLRGDCLVLGHRRHWRQWLRVAISSVWDGAKFIVEESEVQHKKLEERSCCLLKTWRKVEGSYCLTVLLYFLKLVWVCFPAGSLMPTWSDFAASLDCTEMQQILGTRDELGWSWYKHIQIYTNCIRFIDIAQS